MLLRLAISNHLSIHARQELSFVAASLKDRDDGLIPCPAVPSGSVLPALIVYGPNGSGKTNLVSAVQFIRSAVLLSHAKGDAKGGVRRNHFRLDPQAACETTRCEVDFLVDGVRHHYGFTATSDAFESEWLYYFPTAHRRRLFEREGGHYQFGRSLGGHNAVISNLTRPNSLFVSAAAQNGHAYLSKVVDFFRSIRVIRNVDVPGVAALAQLNEEGGIDSRVIDFLQRAGTGVVGYKRHEVEVPVKVRAFSRELFAAVLRLAEVPEEEFPDPAEVLEEFPDPVDTRVIYELTHLAVDGKPVPLELERESAGTRRLLLMLGGAFKAIDGARLLVVDELDASLHTQVCEAVLRVFCDRANNPRGAQLLATTHDTNLMPRSHREPHGLLRRDQLWFVEKNRAGASELYPLTDYRTRKGDNFERGYLQGRFGATPFPGR